MSVAGGGTGLLCVIDVAPAFMDKMHRLLKERYYLEDRKTVSILS